METIINKRGDYYHIFKVYADAQAHYDALKAEGKMANLHPNPAEAFFGGLNGYVVTEQRDA